MGRHHVGNQFVGHLRHRLACIQWRQALCHELLLKITVLLTKRRAAGRDHHARNAQWAMGPSLQRHHAAHAVPHQNSFLNIGCIQQFFQRQGQIFKTQCALKLTVAIPWHVPCQGAIALACKEFNRRLKTFFTAANTMQKHHRVGCVLGTRVQAGGYG